MDRNRFPFPMVGTPLQMGPALPPLPVGGGMSRMGPGPNPADMAMMAALVAAAQQRQGQQQPAPMPFNIPAQSVGQQQRFFEQNLPPGQQTYAGNARLNQALSGQRDPAAVAAAAQQDLAVLQAQQRPTGFEPLTSLDQVTDAMLGVLPPDLRDSVIQRRQTIAADPTIDPELVKQNEGPLLTQINSELDRRVSMTQEQRTTDDAMREQQGGASDILATLGSPLAALDAPRRASVGRAGEDAYKIASGHQQSAIGQFLTWFPGKTNFESWSRDPKNAPFIRNAYENGYTADNGASFTGGQAVWELFVNNEDRWHRGVYDFAYDPLTYAGAVTKPLEGAAAAARASEPTSAAGRAVTGVLGAASDLAQVPDILLNQTADHAVSGALGAIKEGIQGIPVAGWLARDAPETIGEDAATRRTQATLIRDGLNEVPTTANPLTTNSGAVTTPIGPQLTAGSLGSSQMGPFPAKGPTIGPIPQPATTANLDPASALPRYATSEPLTVTPDGEVLPNDPNYFANGAEPTVRQPEPTPIKVTQHKSGRTYVGDASEYRISERGAGGNKVFWVEEQRSDGKGYTAIRSYATRDQAVEGAVARLRGEVVPDAPTPSQARLIEQTTNTSPSNGLDLNTSRPKTEPGTVLVDPSTGQPVRVGATQQPDGWWATDGAGRAWRGPFSSKIEAVDTLATIFPQAKRESEMLRLAIAEENRGIPARTPGEPTVTLFRGETPHVRTSDPERRSPSGRWYTDDINTAIRFAGEDGTVYQIQVPQSVAEHFRVRNIPEAQVMSTEWDREFVLPKSIADARTRVERPQWGEQLPSNDVIPMIAPTATPTPGRVTEDQPLDVRHPFGADGSGRSIISPDNAVERGATPPAASVAAEVSTRRRYLNPKPDGQRVQDVASRLQTEHPERWQAFVDEYTPSVAQKYAGDEALDTQYGPHWSPEKGAVNAIRDVEHVIDDAIPAFQRTFGDVADVPQPTYQYERSGRGTTVKKGSFRQEPTEYLIERAVLSDQPESAAGALGVLRHRANNTDEAYLHNLIPQIEAARQRFVALGLPTTARANPGEGVNVADFLRDAARWIATGERPTEAAPPLTQPHPSNAVDAETQSVLDEIVNHPDYAGQTVSQVIDTLTQEARADQEEVKRLIESGVTPETPKRGRPSGGKLTTTETVTRHQADGSSARVTKPVPIKAAKPGQRLAELQLKWRPFGNIETADPRRLANHRLGQVSREEFNPREARKLPLAADLFVSLVYRTPRSLLLADPLTSWAYTGRNIISNVATAAGVLKANDIPVSRTANVRQQIAAARHIEDSIATDLLGDTFGDSGRGLVDTISGRTTSLDVIEAGRRTPTRDLLARLKLPEVVAKGFDKKRSLDQAIERGMKIGGAFVPLFRAFIAEKIDPLAANMAQFAASRRVALDSDALSKGLWAARKESGGLSRHDVYDTLYRAANEAGADDSTARLVADRGARDWQAAAKEAFDHATNEVNRAFPSRRMTNADKYLSYVVLFHMWPTRAARFFLEESIRDPRLPLWWYRAHEGLNHLAQEEDYPTAAKGLIHLAQGPLGFALYADPAAFFMLQSLLPDKADHPDPQGETGLGHALKWLRGKTGLAPVPFYDALLNMSGVYGDDFLPDPIPGRSRQLAGAALDVLLTSTGHGMGTPIYQQTMAKLRGFVSGAVGVSEVPYADPAVKRSDPIASMVLNQNPDLFARYTDPSTQADAEAELAAIMNNETDPKYQAAEQAVAKGGLFTALAGAFSPIGLRLKNPTREAIKDAAHAVPTGLAFDQMTPQQQADKAAWSGITTTPEALTAKAQQDQYGEIGFKRGQQITQNWNLLAHGSINELMQSNPMGHVLDATGTQVSYRALVGMTPQERMDIADAYLNRHGLKGEYDTVRTAQGTFKDEHPVYKGFSDWRGMVGKVYNDDVAAFREAMMGASPSYRTYIGRLRPDVKKDKARFDAASISMDGYLAMKGTKANVYAPDLGGDPTAWANTEILLNALGGSNASTKKKYDLTTPEGQLANLTDKLTTYQQDMATYSQAALSETKGVPFESLPPQFQKLAEQNLARRGVKKPSAPEVVSAFNMWRMAQPDPAKATPESYIDWMQQYAATAQEQPAA